MPRVLPSDVVRVIGDAFPWAAPGNAPTYAGQVEGPGISAICDLIDRIPEELLPLSSDDYPDFLRAVAGIRYLTTTYATGAHQQRPWPWVRKRNAMVLLLELLKKCPDEGVAASTAGLEFIGDEEFRASVRLDISSSEAALNGGQWKAATVLAGSALEALLLWSIVREGDPERQRVFQTAKTELRPVADPNSWTLETLIEVAGRLGDITEPTAKQAHLARDFRNFIHPGRENRRKIKCSKGNAHAGFAALNLAIADLEKRWGTGSR